MIENTIANKFEFLCKVASESNWCWKIGCTTCGCLKIKAAFYAISINKM